eukprot:TRINITY_DN2474_c0_g1_i1.p1 TRINITY_DN2474_c0_g1~~TRINITY_DN2474_c0_g1_i1.p1  ORF type:complete len:97 (-),score=2.44 TRINITY_DN2474_c0_g1_i1:143-433(-)
MVCTDCEKKLTKVACPDPWKEGSKSASRDPKRTNVSLQKSQRFTPYKVSKCAVCKMPTTQKWNVLCSVCVQTRCMFDVWEESDGHKIPQAVNEVKN